MPSAIEIPLLDLAGQLHLDMLERGEDSGDPRLPLEWLRREHERHLVHVRR